jgi:hypothetical protein
MIMKGIQYCERLWQCNKSGAARFRTRVHGSSLKRAANIHLFMFITSKCSLPILAVLGIVHNIPLEHFLGLIGLDSLLDT